MAELRRVSVTVFVPAPVRVAVVEDLFTSVPRVLPYVPVFAFFGSVVLLPVVE